MKCVNGVKIVLHGTFVTDYNMVFLKRRNRLFSQDFRRCITLLNRLGIYFFTSQKEIRKEYSNQNKKIETHDYLQALSSIFNVATQNNTISNASVNGGSSVIDNSSKKNITVGTSEINNNIPAYIIDDLNNLFFRASQKYKTKEIIEAFDDFIYTQKKNLRD